MKKIRLMLAKTTDDEALRRELAMERKRLDIAVPGLFRHATAFRLHDDELHQAARGPIYAGAPPFDAMMEIAVNSDDALGQAARVLTGLSDRLAGVIRPADCAVVAGSSHDILPGAGPVHLAICGRRLPHLDHNGYINHWFYKHSGKARDADRLVKGLFYRQFHADWDLSADIAGMAGLGIADFDGMSETYFMDGKTLSGLYNEPGVWEAALTDELRFVDHSRSVLSLLLMEDAKAG